jgi:integrase
MENGTMPRMIARLPETTIRNAKPKAKNYKLVDEGGLRVLVRTSGTKIWQYHYQFMGKWKTLTLGQYPLLGMADARKARDQAKTLLQDGMDPGEHKKAEKLKREYEHKNSFEALAREWHSKQNWVQKHADNILSRLEEDVFPYIRHKPINKITRQEVLQALQHIEARGALDVAKRNARYCSAIFEYALIKGLCENNPATNLSKILKSRPVKHRPFLREKQIPDFLRKLKTYHGNPIVRLALEFLMLTFVRPGELRGARWEEIDEKAALWIIPAERMKMSREHIVPLSRQALAILAEIRKISGDSPILFPGKKNFKTPISDVTMLKAIKILGYHGKISPHGARATASTLLNEKGFRWDAVERQLAHLEGNKIRGAYNHAEYLKECRIMMQWYADHLEKLTNGTAIEVTGDGKEAHEAQIQAEHRKDYPQPFGQALGHQQLHPGFDSEDSPGRWH